MSPGNWTKVNWPPANIEQILNILIELNNHGLTKKLQSDYHVQIKASPMVHKFYIVYKSDDAKRFTAHSELHKSGNVIRFQGYTKSKIYFCKNSPYGLVFRGAQHQIRKRSTLRTTDYINLNEYVGGVYELIYCEDPSIITRKM